MPSRVLVVDDDVAVLRALGRLLTSSRYETRCVGSPRAALDRLQEDDYALVVSDLRMEGMSGLELLRKAREVAPRTLRIMLSAYGDARTIQAAVNEGEVHRYFTKPWDDDILRHEVEACVNRYERQALERQTPTTCVPSSLPPPPAGPSREVDEALASVFRLLAAREDVTAAAARRTAAFARALGWRCGCIPADLRILEQAAWLFTLAGAWEGDAPEALRGGAETLRGARTVLEAVGERWDGQGGPLGLKGTEIPLLSRVLRVAVAYVEALQGADEGETRQQASARVWRSAGACLDPLLVRLLLCEVVPSPGRGGAPDGAEKW